MTPDAIEIQAAALACLENSRLFKKVQRVANDIEPESDTPCLSVLRRRERQTPAGDATAGEPSFTVELTLGFQVALYGNSVEKAEDRLTLRLQQIMATLLRSPAFLGLIEGVTGTDEAHDVQPRGEKFYGIGVLEMTVQYFTTWAPDVPDDFLSMSVASKPFGSGEGTPSTTLILDISQE